MCQVEIPIYPNNVLNEEKLVNTLDVLYEQNFELILPIEMG